MKLSDAAVKKIFELLLTTEIPRMIEKIEKPTEKM
jgi:hypothetical protein